jgi:hypothetical protein
MNDYWMAKNGIKMYDDSKSPSENAAKQVGGNHYQLPIEPWDYIVANNLGYLEGNVIKYVTRYKQKNGIEDLLKAQHYLEKLIETRREKYE